MRQFLALANELAVQLDRGQIYARDIAALATFVQEVSTALARRAGH